jgi:hypothetical protein
MCSYMQCFIVILTSLAHRRAVDVTSLSVIEIDVRTDLHPKAFGGIEWFRYTSNVSVCRVDPQALPAFQVSTFLSISDVKWCQRDIRLDRLSTGGHAA